MLKNSQKIITSFIFAALISFVSPTKAFAQMTDPLVNTGFEQEVTGTPTKAYDWQDFMGGYSRSTNAKTGSWAITLTNSSNTAFSGAYQRIDLNQTALKPVFIGGYVKGSSISNSGSWYGASIYTEIYLTNGKTIYWNSLGNTGTFDWRWIGFNTGTVPGIDAPISHIFVIPVLGNSAGTAHFDDLTVIEQTPAGGAVSFMFDDGEASTYTQAYPVLKAKGYPGVAAIVTSFVGDSGFVKRAQVLDLQRNGWEIVSHTLTHNDLTAMTTLRAQRELSQSKSTLTAWGLNVNSFAFPFGAYNANLLAYGSSLYTSMRPYEQGDNPKGSWPYQIRVRGITSATTPAQIRAWAEESKAKGTWNIFTYHSVDSVADDEYRTDPAVFTQMVNEVAASGVAVVTYQEGLNRFAATR
jgi:peptidoglycan/xylan/chitin deacetylase (PgdA/CDA1 family)